MDTDSNLPVYLVGDSRKLNQILMNLLSNAIKYTREGTLFWFDIDLKKGTDNGYEGNVNETFIAPEAYILAVDDNNMNLTVLKSLLKRTLIKVDTAQSAEECYELCKKRNYDLILMDYMMPDIDGIEAMEELHRMNFDRTKKIPIIVLTADATPEKKKLFMDKGFDDYLLKPIDVSLLENVMIKHLDPDLVTVVEKQEQIEIPDKTIEYLKSILSKFDISFEMAMKHLSGDILQFVRIAEFFIENADSNIFRVKELIRQKNYEKAALMIHSIKGNTWSIWIWTYYGNKSRKQNKS